ncbi:MAG: hypothetical protein E7169_04880 [Firmicutes bacterium]|nr:hypothetical protein [Bacillota bacterium]
MNRRNNRSWFKHFLFNLFLFFNPISFSFYRFFYRFNFWFTFFLFYFFKIFIIKINRKNKFFFSF